jgi:PAS domain S-box-containing protein/putative nucleotidyltransferase with HDIG domain
MNRQRTILIADDDYYARLTLRSLLDPAGYRVLEAATGTEALQQAAEMQPDLIMLDVLMPALDGFEVCRRLRNDAQLREIPILLLTALNDPDSRLYGLDIGADGFISKPFDRAELLAQVRTITRLNRYRLLLSEQARFERLIRLSPDGIAILNADHRFLLANPTLVVMLGAIDANSLLGQSLPAYILPESLDRYYAAVQILQQSTQQGVCVELFLQQPGGSDLAVEISIGSFHDLEHAYVQVIFRDITARKQAETQIQRQISQLTSLYAIGTAITANLDLDDVLNVLLDRIVDHLGVDAANVLLMDRHTSLLGPAASRGLALSQAQESLLKPDEGLAGMALQTCRPLAVTTLTGERLHCARDQELAAAFSSYFAWPLLARGEVHGVLEIMYRTPFEPDNNWWIFVNALAVQAAIAIHTARLFADRERANAELMHSYDATIQGWSRALDLRDRETEGHSVRVTELAMQLARRMNLPPEEIDHIRRGALLHDIGKMGVPDHILLKPGPLSSEEWDVMRMHPKYAYEWLSPIPFLHPALAIPYAHHERWDGKGYPRGLCAEQIPLAARIFAVVDVWDALCSHRPYREAWPETRAIEHIRALAGSHFDPQVVEVFLELIHERITEKIC